MTKILFPLFAAVLFACVAHAEDGFDNSQIPGFERFGNDLLPPVLNVPNPVGYGKSLVLGSADGSRLAVGHPYGYTHGVVYVYRNSDGSAAWNAMKTFLGMPNGKIGEYFSFSADGSRIAIRGNSPGYPTTVKVHNVDTGALIGSELKCDDNAQFGRKVSLSATGNVLAMSCEHYDVHRGKVNFYQLNAAGDKWEPRGSLQGVKDGDLFGWDTSLADSGNRVAIAAPGYEGVGGLLTDRGSVGVYDYNSATQKWNLVGNLLQGDQVRDRFGTSVALSADGRVLVASSPGPGIFNTVSTIKTYILFSYTGLWTLLGQLRSTSESMNGVVQINDNGTRIAFTSTIHSAPDANVVYSRMRVFDYELGVWKQHGHTMTWSSDASKPERLGLSLNLDRLAVATTTSSGQDIVRIMDSVSESYYYAADDGSTEPHTDEESFDIGDEYSIKVIDVSAGFTDDEAAQEIRAIYEFDSRHEVAFSVMELDCQSPVDSAFISFGVSHETVPTDEEKTRLNVALDINHTSITESPVYNQINHNTAMMALCLRVDILNADMETVVSEMNRLYVEMNTVERFNMTNIDIESSANIDFQLKVSLDYDVTACQCDENLICNQVVLTPLDEARICVQSASSTVDVAGIQRLKLSQGSLSQTAIRNNTVIEPYTRMEKVGNTVVIHVRLASGFFNEDDPADVVALGVCYLQFHNLDGETRYLRSSIRGYHEGNQRRRRGTTTDVDEDEESSTGFDVGFRLVSAAALSSLSSNGGLIAPVWMYSSLSAVVVASVVVGMLLWFCNRKKWELN